MLLFFNLGNGDYDDGGDIQCARLCVCENKNVKGRRCWCYYDDDDVDDIFISMFKCFE